MREYIFGFGRRSCPGRELADASLFMFVTMSVAALDIRPLAGADLSTMLMSKRGRAGFREPSRSFFLTISCLGLLLRNTYSSRHSEPFSVDARPRSPAIEALVRAVETEYPWNDHDAEAISHLDLKRRL